VLGETGERQVEASERAAAVAALLQGRTKRLATLRASVGGKCLDGAKAETATATAFRVMKPLARERRTAPSLSLIATSFTTLTRQAFGGRIA